MSLVFICPLTDPSASVGVIETFDSGSLVGSANFGKQSAVLGAPPTTVISLDALYPRQPRPAFLRTGQGCEPNCALM